MIAALLWSVVDGLVAAALVDVLAVVLPSTKKEHLLVLSLDE